MDVLWKLFSSNANIDEPGLRRCDGRHCPSTHTPIEKDIPWGLLTAERQSSDGYNFFDELSIALQTLSMPLAMESKECCL